MPKTKTPAKPMSRTKQKAKTARKQMTPKGARKTAGAHGVEPITEGPYANSGPEFDKRVSVGRTGELPRLTNPGSVSI